MRVARLSRGRSRSALSPWPDSTGSSKAKMAVQSLSELKQGVRDLF